MKHRYVEMQNSDSYTFSNRLFDLYFWKAVDRESYVIHNPLYSAMYHGRLEQLATMLIAAALASSCSFQPTNQWNSSITVNNITISTLTNAAGAIGSLQVNGFEYIDSSDHGRLLQSAVSYDNQGEKNNPTEGGSDADGPMSSVSTSRLLSLKASGNSLETTQIPVLWLPIGPKIMSNDTLSKHVVIGYQGHANVIQYDVTFNVGDPHQVIVFESLTGYMPIKFNTYYTRVNGVVTQVTQVASGVPGESIMATGDGLHAMAIKDLDAGSYTVNWTGSTFLATVAIPCTKWSAVNIIHTPSQPGAFTFHHLLVVGTLSEVLATLNQL